MGISCRQRVAPRFLVGNDEEVLPVREQHRCQRRQRSVRDQVRVTEELDVSSGEHDRRVGRAAGIAPAPAETGPEGVRRRLWPRTVRR
jgi:hypothetical protein